MRTATCCFFKFGGDAGGSGLTERHGRLLGGRPRAKWSAVILVVIGKQSSVDTNAVAIGSGVQRHVHGGVCCIGEKSAFVQRKVGVGVAQDEGGDAPVLQFLAQAASESDGDIFLRERAAQRFAAVRAAMAGVDNGEVTARGSGSRRGCKAALE